jgi:NTP pyrophosphatase (non-canonical NTP hydrolase)
MKLDAVINAVLKELELAESKFPPFNSPHEGYSILLEEVDELWDEVKSKDSLERDQRMKEEAIQVGAMALKFLLMFKDE